MPQRGADEDAACSPVLQQAIDDGLKRSLSLLAEMFRCEKDLRRPFRKKIVTLHILTRSLLAKRRQHHHETRFKRRETSRTATSPLPFHCLFQQPKTWLSPIAPTRECPFTASLPNEAHASPPSADSTMRGANFHLHIFSGERKRGKVIIAHAAPDAAISHLPKIP